MELQDLRYFIAAYEATELTESAPQALRLDASVRVRRLEALVGARLFDLRNGRTFPTRAGDELYAHAKQRIGVSQTGQTTIPLPQRRGG